MRLIRSKKFHSLKDGEQLLVKKLSEPEFILKAKMEISKLFAEGVSFKDPEKFADLMEIVNNVCTIVNIDWYECSKIKSRKKWEDGTYECFLAAKEVKPD